MSKPTAPKTLHKGGRTLWDRVVDTYDLRVDELRVLEDACSEADLIDTLAGALTEGELMIRGSQGQQVINPLVAELRQHRNTLKGLMQALKLPDDGDVEREAGDRSSAARAAANARWSRRGA